MKKKITKFRLLVAMAIVSISQLVTATSPKETFTPIEKLDPSQRAAIQERLEVLEKQIKVDWDKMILGVDEKGEFVLRNRAEYEFEQVAHPTCCDDGL